MTLGTVVSTGRVDNRVHTGLDTVDLYALGQSVFASGPPIGRRS